MPTNPDDGWRSRRAKPAGARSVLERRIPDWTMYEPSAPDAAHEDRILDNQQIHEAVDEVERWSGDEQLRARLAADNFAGPEYVRFLRELAAYGLAVCVAKLISGEIFRECADLNRPCGDPPPDWDAHDRQSLADETVALALKHFHAHGMVGGGWSPSGGTSIKRYFIGACVLAFPNVFRAWQRERKRWNTMSAALAHQPHQRRATTDPSVLVATRQHVIEGLGRLDDRTRTVIVLTEMGYSQKEIAEIMGLTVRSVEGVLYRHRSRLEGTHGGEDLD